MIMLSNNTNQISFTKNNNKSVKTFFIANFLLVNYNINLSYEKPKQS